MTHVMESKCWEKSTENLDKSEKQQNSATIHESFNQLKILLRIY